MTERYDSTAAAHYAAYRPPLHRLILSRVFSEGDCFGKGLDVGCGTGYSAIELARYCGEVFAIDPSNSMLARATAHERVRYLGGSAEDIPLGDDSVDVATFAGSLFYADRSSAAGEVIRVGRDGAVVLVYDFEVLLDEVLRACGVRAEASGSDYDHRVNFSGMSGLTELAVVSERVGLRISVPELVHVLLSDSHRFDLLAGRVGSSDPFPALVEEIGSRSEDVTLDADLFYSSYRIAKA
jgi:SAM-dependent methyltransferase